MVTPRASCRKRVDHPTMKNAAARIATVAVLATGALALPVSAASAAVHKGKHHGTRNHPVMAHIAVPNGAGPR
jgi:hypothetical protein